MNLMVYVISDCPQCSDAIEWLEEKGLDFQVVNLEEYTPIWEELEGFAFLAGVEIEDLLEEGRGQYGAISPRELQKIIATDPHALKRPIISDGRSILIGWDEKMAEEFIKET